MRAQEFTVGARAKASDDSLYNVTHVCHPTYGAIVSTALDGALSQSKLRQKGAAGISDDCNVYGYTTVERTSLFIIGTKGRHYTHNAPLWARSYELNWIWLWLGMRSSISMQRSGRFDLRVDDTTATP